jgi:hypothetical protein
LKKFLRKHIPDAREVRSRRFVAAFGGWLQHHPNLWCVNRRSVSGGVAIGLFAGLIPGPFQMLGALLLAIPLRRNIPVALVTTLYTNPLTIVPLYLLAYRFGQLLLGEHGGGAVPPFEMNWTDWAGSLHALIGWTLRLGKPLAVGLPALAITLAVIGYAAVQLAWRLYVAAAWRARKRRREGRA